MFLVLKEPEKLKNEVTNKFLCVTTGLGFSVMHKDGVKTTKYSVKNMRRTPKTTVSYSVMDEILNKK